MVTCKIEKGRKHMEEQEREAQEFVNRVYSFAANLMFEQEKSATETKRILVEEGLREEDAEG